jgi:hypothetical protein
LEIFSDWYCRGSIKPINPVKYFEADDIVSAFRYMQAGTHLGKIVVHMPNNPDSLPSPVVKSLPSFRSDASYLLVGGLGGIGRSVSTWMVEQGAKELVLLSRTAGQSDKDQAFIRELEMQGCHVILMVGNVTNKDDVNKAVDKCTRPLAGVLQMAVDLKVSSDFCSAKPVYKLTRIVSSGSFVLTNDLRGMDRCPSPEISRQLESASRHGGSFT